MKTAVVNFKTDEATKKKAQHVANELGIPLSNLLNAYLNELAVTGSVHFAVAEPMSAKTEAIVAKAEVEIANGKISKPFATLEDLFAHLDQL